MELRQKRVILVVPTCQRGRGFYSPLFLVKKKTGDLRPVLDLKNLKKKIKIKIKTFKMESLAINLEDWMLSVDLSHSHTSAFQKCQKSSVNHHYFQFLPFDISSPRTFTNLYQDTPLSRWHSASSRKSWNLTTLENTGHDSLEIQLVNQLGEEQPSAHTKYDILGGRTENEVEQGTASSRKGDSTNPKEAKTVRYLPARVCRSILGSMSATLPMIQWAQWHMRVLQYSFLMQWDRAPMLQTIPIHSWVKQSVW